MKKIFTLVACAIVTLGAAAQVQFGAKVGLNGSHFWGENAPHGLMFGPQVGVLMEYKFTPNFAIAPEAVFSMQGSSYNKTTTILGIEGKYKVNYNTNYINVPIMLKYYVSPDFSIDFGPQVGFNVYSKRTQKEPEKLDAINMSDYTNTVDFGLGLGATYSLNEHVFLQARYNLGLTKVYKDIATNIPSLKNAKNGNAQVAIGFKF